MTFWLILSIICFLYDLYEHSLGEDSNVIALDGLQYILYVRESCLNLAVIKRTIFY